MIVLIVVGWPSKIFHLLYFTHPTSACIKSVSAFRNYLNQTALLVSGSMIGFACDGNHGTWVPHSYTGVMPVLCGWGRPPQFTTYKFVKLTHIQPDLPEATQTYIPDHQRCTHVSGVLYCIRMFSGFPHTFSINWLEGNDFPWQSCCTFERNGICGHSSVLKFLVSP